MSLVKKLLSPTKNLILAGAIALSSGCGNDVANQASEYESNPTQRREQEQTSLDSAISKSGHQWWKQQEKDYVENYAGLNMKMIWIPGAELEIENYAFARKSPENSFKKVSGFWIQETEFTVGQWLEFLRKTNYNPGQDTVEGKGGYPRNMRNTEMPITDVSYRNATFTADKLKIDTKRGYSLPSPEQWMLAARGPKPISEESLTEENSNLTRDIKTEKGEERKHGVLEEVRKRAPNSSGLYGTRGNAAEFLRPSEEEIERARKEKDSAMVHGGYYLDFPIFLAPGMDETPGIIAPSMNGYLKSVPFRSDYYEDTQLFRPHIGFRLVRNPEEDLN